MPELSKCYQNVEILDVYYSCSWCQENYNYSYDVHNFTFHFYDTCI